METNKNWSILPTHKPAADLWERIDTELDFESVSSNLDQLPSHSPKLSIWNSINKKLFFRQYLHYFYIAGIGISATILFFVYIGFFQKDNKTSTSKEVVTELSGVKPATNEKNNKPSVSVFSIESDKKNTNSLSVTQKNHAQILPLKNIGLKEKSKLLTDNKSLEKDNVRNEIRSDNIGTQSKQLIVTEELPVQNSAIIEKKVSTNVSNSSLVASPIMSVNSAALDQINVANQKPIVKANEDEKNIEIPEKSVDKIQEINEIQKIEVTESDNKKIQIKSTDSPLKHGLYSMGVDYTINKIYNPDKFSHSKNTSISQYGITLKYNYSRWCLQTGINFSRLKDNYTYHSDQQLNQLKTYNYVDSVIYNPQGSVIQYITHPITFNDSILFQDNVSVNKTYSFLNIPVMIAYQYGNRKFTVSLKAGILCTVIISEKETMILPDKPGVSVLKIYSENSAINSINWAGLLSLEIDYHITKRWGFSVEPVIQYYFKPLYQGMDVYTGNSSDISPYLIGLKTGLFYKF